MGSSKSQNHFHLAKNLLMLCHTDWHFPRLAPVLSQPLLIKQSQIHKQMFVLPFQSKMLVITFNLHQGKKRYGCIEMTLTLKMPFVVFPTIV